MKKALITWITGQDGAYLAEFLLNKWYEVHGIKRRASSLNTERIDHLYEWPQKKGRKFVLHYGDMTDSVNLIKLVAQIQPDEIYNLAAQSHVHVSFDIPEYTANSDAVWVLRLLEAIRIAWLEKSCKFYQASTSELYGWMWYNMPATGYTEESLFHPRSPYGVAKLYGFWITKNYCEAYNMFACNGILFNHESPIRGETFVSRKITRAIAQISLGLENMLYLGNLDAKRDRGHAKDFVQAMWLMLQTEKPDDYVIATGESHSVREFTELAFKEVGIEIEWRWTGIDEKWYDKKTGKCLIGIDAKYFRPAEVQVLLGNPSKAKKKLHWEPKHTFEEMVKEMIQSDLQLFKKQKILKEHGYEILKQYE